MTRDEKEEFEIKAERLVRRGEFAQALRIFLHVQVAFPEDAHLRARIDELQASLEPSELSLKSAMPEAAPTPIHEAESLCSRGDFAGAIAIYRKLIQARPDWELGKERMTELFHLAQSARPHKRPLDRVALYEELLQKISNRRKM
jgi:tetratricopeptide (TPR) repeat protein